MFGHLHRHRKALPWLLVAALTWVPGCHENTFAPRAKVAPTPSRKPMIWETPGSETPRVAVSPYPTARTCIESLPATGDRELDRVIPADCEVQVPRGYHIEYGSLTIEAGATLVFAPKAALTVGFEGPTKLLIRGTEQNPVQMHGLDGAAFEGIRLMKHADGSQISYLSLTGAGTRQHGALHSEAEDLSVDHTTIVEPASVGVHITGDGTLARFAANSITSATPRPGHPFVLLPPVALHAFDATNRFPKQSVIHVLPGLIRVPGRWPRISVPLIIGGDIEIAGSNEQVARVEIAAGNELRFQSEANLSVGYFDPGALILAGTAKDPVVLTSADAHEPGTWKGIKMYKHASGEFRHARFEYGGQELDRGVLYATSQAEVTVEDCEFRDNLVGLVFFRDGIKLHPFRRNRFANTPRVARFSPTALGAFDGSNTIEPSKDGDRPRIVTEIGTVTTDTRWSARGAVIELRGPMSVDDGATLTVAAGTEFEVADGFSLDVGERASAGLEMRGSPEQPIKIAGTSKKRGSWDAIVLHPQVREALLTHVELTGAGGEAAIEVRGEATARVTDVSCINCYSPVLTWDCASKVDSNNLTAHAGTPGTRAPPTGCNNPSSRSGS